MIARRKAEDVSMVDGWMYIIGVVFLLPRFVERRFFPGLGALFAAVDARLQREGRFFLGEMDVVLSPSKGVHVAIV